MVRAIREKDSIDLFLYISSWECVIELTIRSKILCRHHSSSLRSNEAYHPRYPLYYVGLVARIIVYDHDVLRIFYER